MCVCSAPVAPGRLTSLQRRAVLVAFWNAAEQGTRVRILNTLVQVVRAGGDPSEEESKVRVPVQSVL